MKECKINQRKSRQNSAIIYEMSVLAAFTLGDFLLERASYEVEDCARFVLQPRTRSRT